MSLGKSTVGPTVRNHLVSGTDFTIGTIFGIATIGAFEYFTTSIRCLFLIADISQAFSIYPRGALASLS
jgi:hypothetical protein